MTPTLYYGFDPLCGWCFGHANTMRALLDAEPELDVRLTLSGLVTGSRVGPYGQMEGYIRGASQRLKAVTGREPSEAFYALIARPGVIGQSAPGCLVLAAARDQLGQRAAIARAHAVTEAHFEQGADLNQIATYGAILSRLGFVLELPAFSQDAANDLFARERGVPVTSFPSLVWQDERGWHAMPTEYDGERLISLVRLLGSGG